MRNGTTDSAVIEKASDANRAEGEEGVVAAKAEFPEFAAASASIASSGAPGAIDHLLDVTIRLTAELGRAEISIGEVLRLGPGSVVALDRGVVELVDLLVQGVPFARAEVVVVDDRFALRIREIIDPKLDRA